MKTRLVLLLGLLSLSTIALAQGESTGADAITGIWQTDSGGYVQIYDAGDSYAGKVVGSVNGVAQYDKNNPDPNKQGRRLLGITVLHGLEYQGDNTWDNGEIYDPDSGNTYSLQATLHGSNTLEVRGYLGFSLFGKSQTWSPVPLDAPNLDNNLLVGELAQ